MANETCTAFDEVTTGNAKTLHRFVVGSDTRPVPLNARQTRALGDPFATLLLAKGKFPRTAEAVIDGLRKAVPRNHALKELHTFVVGEGSQLSGNQARAGLRFIVTLGRGQFGPDVFLSVGDPRQVGGIEVAAWRRGAGGFNYYRSTGAMWMFAGNSSDALKPKSRLKGPFESHPSGAMLMKELKSPWQNWHSQFANIPVTVLPRGDALRRHPWFADREDAYALEAAVAASISRWARRRFAGIRKSGGTITRTEPIMEQIIGTPMVNLITSFRESRALRDNDVVELPPTFFVDNDAFAQLLGFDFFPPTFAVKAKIYKRALEKFDVRFAGRPGDTHFCFLVPERALEDLEVQREATEIGLVTPRLAASLLMVDPWNPIFSERRRALLEYVPDKATIRNKRSTFSRDMAANILAAAEGKPADSPEAEFKQRWDVGASFRAPFKRILKSYFTAVEGKLGTQAGFDPYFQLAEEQRRRFFDLSPIAREFDLLLPKTNINPTGRRMRKDGTVGR
jgi:hypothetical protein